MRRIIHAALLVSLSTSLLVSQAKIGTTAAQFLGIAAGAKAVAMGGAYVAANDDATGLYWNPGSVGFLRGSHVAFSNTKWLAGTDYRWVGAVFSFDGVNYLGASLTNLDYGEEEVTTELAPDGTGERWTASDVAFAVTYTRRFTDRFSIGGSAKYISQQIYNETASTFALDFGLVFITGFNDMRLGMSISNFGGNLTMEGRDLLQPIDIDPANSGSNKSVPGLRKTDDWPIPLFFRVGLAMDVFKTDFMSWTIAADALRPSDNVETVNVGTQIGWADLVFLRAGVRGIGKDQREEGFSFGGGVRLGLSDFLSVEADYAYTQFGFFGNLNTLAVGIRF